MAYQGNYVSQVPEWNPADTDTVEPPADRQGLGWEPGLNPPAQWLNYFHKRYYESIKELDNALKAVDDDQDAHVGNSSNPHEVSASQIGANAILNELLKVDGSGSDLNADLLDGQDFVDIKNWVNNNAEVSSADNADTVDGEQANELLRVDGSRYMEGDLNLGDNEIKNIARLKFGYNQDELFSTIQGPNNRSLRVDIQNNDDIDSFDIRYSLNNDSNADTVGFSVKGDGDVEVPTGILTVRGNKVLDVSDLDRDLTAGYTRLANGVFIQWGTIDYIASDTETLVTFPITFPNECLVVTATPRVSSGSPNSTSVYANIENSSSVTIANSDPDTDYGDGIYWIAIGY